MSERRAVVTGATSGIGEALVYLLCKRNWAVIGVGRNQASLEEKAQSLKPRFIGIAADVTDESSVSNLASEVESLKSSHGQITALFQCAGAIPGDKLFHTIEETTQEFFEEVWRINLLSKLLVAKALLPYIEERGCIINVASIAAHEIFPNEVAYHSTMWGVRGLTQAMDAELQERGIRVSSVSPGSVRTPLMERLVDGGDFPPEELERALDPREVAETILHIAEKIGVGVYIPDMRIDPK